MSTQVTSWSYSRLKDYETCPYRVKLKVIDKIPGPPPEPNNPLERGERIHKGLELSVTDGTQMPVEATKFAPLVDRVRNLYAAGQVDVEQMWGYDEGWNETSVWKDMWLRAKLDINVRDPDRGIVIPIDYKTGKRFGKEVDHVQQTQLYASIAALRFPWAQIIWTEIWYIDQGSTLQLRYTREQALNFVPRFEMRAYRMLEDTRFKPRPSVINCKWCDYGPNKLGVCPFGVSG